MLPIVAISLSWSGLASASGPAVQTAAVLNRSVEGLYSIEITPPEAETLKKGISDVVRVAKNASAAILSVAKETADAYWEICLEPPKDEDDGGACANNWEWFNGEFERNNERFVELGKDLDKIVKKYPDAANAAKKEILIGKPTLDEFPSQPGDAAETEPADRCDKAPEEAAEAQILYWNMKEVMSSISAMLIKLNGISKEAHEAEQQAHKAAYSASEGAAKVETGGSDAQDAVGRFAAGEWDADSVRAYLRPFRSLAAGLSSDAAAVEAARETVQDRKAEFDKGMDEFDHLRYRVVDLVGRYDEVEDDVETCISASEDR